MQVFNPKSQKHQNVEWAVDANGEIVCTFPDGHFLKFPAGTSQGELNRLVKKHEKVNKGQEVITPEMEAEREAAREKSEALVSSLNEDTTSESQSNDEESPTEPDS